MGKAKDGQLVVKANRLVEASYRLTTQEQRIILLMASMIKRGDEHFHTYRIDIKNFMHLVGVNVKDSYARVKQITRKLRSRELLIKTPKSELQIGWLSSAEYFDGKGYVELSFDPKLKPYLLCLKEYFTRYRLKNVIRLKSSYAIRVYELLKQYEHTKQRTFQLEELKKILGIREGEYKLYADFKRKVILKSQKELNEKTDLSFDFIEIKDGRRVSALRFLIKPNDRGVEPEEQDENGISQPLRLPRNINQELYDRLQSYYCLSPKQARNVLESYDEEYILGNLSYVEEQHKKGRVKNIGSYTLKALQEDFRNKESKFDIERREQEAQERADKVKQEENERLRLSYERYIADEVERLKKTLPKEELEAMKKEAEQIAQDKYRGIPKGIKIGARWELESIIKARKKLPGFEEWKENVVEMKK